MRALKDVKRGFYIDVGACAPDADSVTRIFYEQGWRGISLEPNPHYLRLLADQRDGDENLGLALSDTEGALTFHLIGETGLSSLNPDIAAAHAAEGRPSTELSVRVSTLQNLWAEHVPAGQEVHFLKIDVEGEEAGVIRGGDWAKHRPWIVVVEATAPTSQKPSHEEWEPILLSHDYRFAYWDGLNRFYVAEEHADLMSAFLTPPNVFDDFVLYRQVLVEDHAKDLTIRLSRLVEENEGLVEESEALVAEREALKEQWTAERNALQDRINTLERQVRYSKRPFWQKVVFRETGRPVRAVRRALFHSNGKPRGIFRRIVQHKNGRPRRAFHEWMSHPEYQALPGAIAFSQNLKPQTFDQEPSISPRTQYFMDRIGQKPSEN